MEDSDIFIVGYGGWVRMWRHANGTKYNNEYKSSPYSGVDACSRQGTLLQVTGASISRTTNLPTQTSYYLPFNDNDNTARSQMLLGEGTYSFNGDISFELTMGALKQFIDDDFLERSSLFSTSFFDGQKACSVTNCVWSSIQLQCAPGSLVSMSISYLSNNGYMDKLQVFDMDMDNSLTYDETDLLIPYWTCGHDDFMEFSINFERNVTPVFLNGDLKTAAYLRPGLVTVSLNATTLEYIDSWDEEIKIKIGAGETAQDGSGGSGGGGKVEKCITLYKSVLQSCQYSMSSMTDTGAKTYTWNSISDDASERVFKIE